MKGKKGISPLIATVLLIGFTVALAALIMVWGQRFTQGVQESTSESSNTQIICATEVDFTIQDVCRATGGGYTVTINNRGSRQLERVVIRGYATASSMVAETLTFGGNGIPAYGMESATYTGTDSTMFFEAIAEITVNSKAVTCSANIKEFGSLEADNILPC